MKIKFNKKSQLVEALEANRTLAVVKDAEAVKKHAADEKAYLAEFRKVLREAARWSYAEAKANRFYPKVEDITQPDCPVPFVERLDKALHFLNLTHQETFTFEDSGWGMDRDIFVLLTLDAPAVKAVC